VSIGIYDEVREDEIARHVARMGRRRKKKNTYKLLVRKQAGMRPLGRSRYRWVNNIMMDHGEIG
jgi:hypothetical protein